MPRFGEILRIYLVTIGELELYSEREFVGVTHISYPAQICSWANYLTCPLSFGGGSASHGKYEGARYLRSKTPISE